MRRWERWQPPRPQVKERVEANAQPAPGGNSEEDREEHGDSVVRPEPFAEREVSHKTRLFSADRERDR